MDENKRIIEINGVKVEIDLRTAKVIEQYKVGDPVKIIDKVYNNDYKVYPAVIVDIVQDGGESAVLQLLCLKESYNEVDISIMTFGENTEKIFIAPYAKYEMKWSDTDINNKFNIMIEKKKEEIRVLETKQSAYNNVILGALNA